MKKRDLILDFTSLLDVTLIVIFFFVLFSHLDSQENKARTDEKIQEYEVAIQEAEDREAIADGLFAQLEEELEIVRTSDERRANNVSEILEYNRNENLKIILDMKESSWGIRIIRKEEVIAYIEKSNSIGSDIIKAMEDSGYGVDQTIFCDFVFDGSEPGTASAYRMISSGLSEASAQYKYLYISETDLSVGGE